MMLASSLAESQQHDSHKPLMGLATLMSMAYAGKDLGPLGVELVGRATSDPTDANALMDLATIMQLDFSPEVAMDLQSQALRIRQHYSLPAKGREAVRVLALMAPGELMANAPLEFLVHDSDISLEMLYVSSDYPLPLHPPEHDVLFVAVNQSDANRPILQQIEAWVKSTSRPVLNAAERIAMLSRTGSHTLLKPAPDIVFPASVRVDRHALAQIGRSEKSICDVLGDKSEFPIIVRPVDSHAGRGLKKIDDPSAILDYLDRTIDSDFYLSPFINYRGTDGLYRKYRVVLIDGHPFACHMAISNKWMVHYLNAGMDVRADKRAEEAQFMASFDEDFAQRHQGAFRAIAERVQLDYLVIDCAEMQSGELLVFEMDSGAVVHAMDPVDVYPYKPKQMHKIFAAFRDMLLKAKRRNQFNVRSVNDDSA